MATQSNSKRQKYTVIDSISALPDSLLCQILSLLPTKQAVVTTTLSTRWQPLWTMVPAFDFDDTEMQNQDYGNKSMAITHFVCGFFTLRKPVPLKKFRLCLNNSYVYDPILVRTWICYAIGHDLEELDLYLNRSQTFELPPSLFSCESLKILELNGKILLNCPSSVHLPNLEILRLIKVKYANDNSLRRLLTGCPNLTMFYIYIGRTQRDNEIALRFLPRLKWFHIIDECQDHEFEIEVNASGFKNLYLYDLDFQNYLLVNTTNVVEATIGGLSERSEQDGQENYSQCILKLLRALPNLHTLMLRYIKSLSVASTYDLPCFNNLRRIKLTVRCCKWHLLPYLLERAQNLEDFVLVKDDTEGPHESCWTEPLHVPKCLTSSLQYFDIYNFRNLDHELELVKYILKNAKVLKAIKIFTGLSNSEENLCILTKLSEFPRASSACEHFFSTNE